MKMNCRLYLTLSWVGILVKADWRPSTFVPSPVDKLEADGKAVKVVKDRIHEESVHGHESTKRYSEEPPTFLNRVPSDFARDIDRLRIPDERVIPKDLSSDEEGQSVEKDSEEREEDSEENRDKSEEDQAEDEENSNEEEYESKEEQSREKDENDARDEYDDYDDNPNLVYESKKEVKKPLKKRPNVVHYEVTETITGDTKPQRPRGPVYPLPPPCPGAPPPTFPPPPPPTVKPPPAPPKNFFPVDDIPLVNQIPFFDSYFPTSYMAQSHTVPQETVYSPPHRFQISPAIIPKGKGLGRFPRRASPQTVIIRYHRPAYVVRKVQHIAPASDPVIVRHVPPPRPKEVHIHHHHSPRQPAGPVIHVHKNDEDDALEEARFTADLAGQKLFSEAELEASSNGHFAEPPIDFDTKKRSVIPEKEVHIHE